MFRPVKPALRTSLCSLALLSACSPAPEPVSEATPEPNPEIAATEDLSVAQAEGLLGDVARLRTDHDLVALGAVIASRDGILDMAVNGARSRDGTDPALISDQWHLGSNTKALTALLYGQLVLRGDAEWGATLPQLFPEIADTIDPAWQDITIEDLFAHRTGMKQLGGFWLNARRNDERPITEQRQIAAHHVLSEPPSKSPDAFDYNNLNYIVAGAAIENILADNADLPDTWEGAMQTMLFDQLPAPSDRKAFGFGPPPEGLVGHRTILGAFPTAVGRGKSADNPAALGPAGTLHATLAAHAAIGIEFLKPDSTIAPEGLRAHLFTPHPTEDSGYALGWGVFEHDDYGRIYQHMGSNTMWYSMILIAPDLDRVIIVNSNVFNDGAQKAAGEIAKAALRDAVAAQSDQ